MALIIDLKPGERIVIGDALITNDGPRTRLSIQGEVPILREKDIVRPEDATTPCRQLYLAIQLMYVGRDKSAPLKTYLELAQEIQAAAPSTTPYIVAINEKIMDGAYFRALRTARQLIEYEERLISNA
jgi:flagellar protein FlbT